MINIRETSKKLIETSIKEKKSISTKLTENFLYLSSDPDGNLSFSIKIAVDDFNISTIPKWKAVPAKKITKMFDGENVDMLELSLNVPEYVDIFDGLIENIFIDQLNDVNDDRDAWDAFVNTLDSWDSCFRNKREGLSRGEQIGLYGELYFLLHNVFPNTDTTSYALKSWRGHSRKHQDFEFNNGNIEVKSTTKKEHRTVSINNEKQLDPRGFESLHLYVLSLREINADSNTLPQLISDIKEYLDKNYKADKRLFKSYLMQAGYFTEHEDRYLENGYFVENEELFDVTNYQKFPSIVDVPSGVGDVQYSIVLAACQDFKVDDISETIKKVT
tara:strand:+ start:1016 stop:2008 length:993 start_codon:yes stop_codon:yes gene_type:complete